MMMIIIIIIILLLLGLYKFIANKNGENNNRETATTDTVHS